MTCAAPPALERVGLRRPPGPDLRLEYPVAIAATASSSLATSTYSGSSGGRLMIVDFKTDAPSPGDLRERTLLTSSRCSGTPGWSRSLGSRRRNSDGRTALYRRGPGAVDPPNRMKGRISRTGTFAGCSLRPKVWGKNLAPLPSAVRSPRPSSAPSSSLGTRRELALEQARPPRSEVRHQTSSAVRLGPCDGVAASHRVSAMVSRNCIPDSTSIPTSSIRPDSGSSPAPSCT